MINWNSTIAAVWRQRKEYLRPVLQTDPIRPDELLGIDDQKQQMIQNTERFLAGKSSLIKALLNTYKDQDLRLIEVDKQDLVYLPDIVDDIRELPQRFIIYCDDLSFETNEHQYKSLKSVLEGSVELPPENILVYATSNRRHLMPERMSDNLDTRLVDGEVHYSDTVEEKISLSDRFGLRLAFYPQTSETYLHIVDSLFPNLPYDRESLHKAALDFAHQRASKSGRTAKQFYNTVADVRFE
jgi:predicted AAA+ superfamily ATPase